MKKPFLKFVSKRTIYYLVIFFCVMSLVFILPRLLPSDPTQIIASKIHSAGGGFGKMDTEALAATFEKKWGLGKPLYEQFGLYWKRLFTLDFAMSFEEKVPVSSFVIPHAIYTIILIFPALILSFFLGNWIGAKVVFSDNPITNYVYKGLVFISSSPFYWWGLIFAYIFAMKLGIFPVGGLTAPDIVAGWDMAFIKSYLYHLALPFFTVFLLATGGWCTGMRSMTLYEKQEDYVYYSRQLGFTNDKIRSDAQRNAILPQITGVPVRLNTLIGQSLIVEFVFNYPGLGTDMASAVSSQDYPVLQMVFFMTALIMLVGNLLMDIAYGFLDPRIKSGYIEESGA